MFFYRKLENNGKINEEIIIFDDDSITLKNEKYDNNSKKVNIERVQVYIKFL